MSEPRPRRGRPRLPSEEHRRTVFSLYLTDAEFAALARLALREGDSMSGFVRSRLLEALGISQCEKRGGA